MTRFSFLILIAAIVVRPMAVHADELLTPEQLEHVQFKFSSFLSGDVQKIRETVNGTLEQQLTRKAEKTRKIDADKAVIKLKQDGAGAKLRAASPVFARMQDDLKTAQADAAAAKKSSDAVALMAAKTKADTLTDQINQQEDAAIATDPDVVARRGEIKETQTELHNLDPAITAAAKARDELIDGLRQPKRIPGPPTVGSIGILGRVKPTKIIDEHSFTTDFIAFEVTGETKNAKTPDGFKAMSGKQHMMHLLVTGADTSKLRVGTEAIVDHVFSVTAKQSGKATVYTVAPVDNDQKSQLVNYLFDALDDLHTGEK